MESQNSPLLSWAYYCQGKIVEELRQSLLYTTLELEQTKLTVQEELRKREEQLINLKDLLSKAMRERDEAQEKFQRILLEKLLLQQQQLMLMQQQPHQQYQNAPHSGISSIEDEPRRGIDSTNGFSSSDCEESIVSSPVIDPIPQPPQLPPPAAAAAVVPTSMPEETIEIVPEKPLPEKGKLLQAVMKAGPLLQTLLLAGPLPQWRHPPPPLESSEIPPVTIPSPPPPPQHIQQDNLVNNNCCSRKRVLCDGFDSKTEANKHQRVALH